jgi:hypothetical protein
MAAVDSAAGHTDRGSIGGPYRNAAAITPSDTTDLPQTTLKLYVGVAGDVAVIMANGAAVTFHAMPVGMHAIQIARVKATGTTATNLIALW